MRGDTIREIAVAEYKDPDMTFLVMYYNDIKDPRKIEINQVLQLPVMVGVIPEPKGSPTAVTASAGPPGDALKATKPPSAPSDAPKAAVATAPQSPTSPPASALPPTVAAVAMLREFPGAAEQPGAAESEYSAESAASKYQEAKKLYDGGDFMKAAAAAEKVLEEDAANGGARELVNAAYYAEGTKLQGQNKNIAAMRSLSRVDPGYKDTSQRVENLQGKLKDQQAEVRYIAGLTFFLNEDLDNAIREWEQVLKLDPSHPQASKDLKIAKGLQAKLSQIK